MEGSGKQELNSGFPLKSDETHESYKFGSTMSPSSGPSMAQAGAVAGSGGVGAAAVAPPSSNMGEVTDGIEAMKKKRGRPRKYGPDGKLTAAAAAAALSPMPISASFPLSGEFSAWKQPRGRGRGRGRGRRGRGSPFEAINNVQKLDFENHDDRLAYMVGANFSPHVITVNAGEDVAMKIYSFGQQDSRAICVLSASGSISNVTIRLQNSSGGTMTYEGRFEILSLSGSFMPTDNGIMKSRSGGISVALASSEGRVFGGGLAGLLVAASPVQVVIGSFLPGHHQEQKLRKSWIETAMTMPAPPNTNPPVIREASGGSYAGVKAMDFTSPTSFHHSVDNINTNTNTNTTNTNTANINMDSLNPMVDISESSPEGESNDDSPSKYERSG
ncbi:AT-hook motif nuclear-localized protein 3-like protein [Drosera capensis]